MVIEKQNLFILVYVCLLQTHEYTLPLLFSGLNIGVGVGGGTTLLLLALSGPFVMHKIRQLKMKKMFFKQNHGLLLQQLVSQNSNICERMIITLEELEKAKF